MSDRERSQGKRLLELAGVGLKLGSTAFGGPAAHVGLMEEEFVRRRRWLTHAEFLDLLGATNLIPGPNSTELVMFAGRRQAGWAGLLVAGVCFILPAMILVTTFAWAYVRFGKLPELTGVLYGVKPVIMAVVVQALWALCRTALRNVTLAAAGLATVALALSGVHELGVLFGTGMVFAAVRMIIHQRSGVVLGLMPFLASASNASLPSVAAGVTATATLPFSATTLFLFFLKVGAVLFGSGYVLLAYLQADLVERWHWLTENQLLDAIAVGQMTPGPILTAATFIGYLLGGPVAGFLATVGVFLPAFVFVAVSGPLLPRLRQSPSAGAFLDGVNVASLALMGVVTWQLGTAAIVDAPTALLALISLGLLLRYRVNSAWLVLGGAVIGWLGFPR